jgi:uncharacterized protein
VATPPGELAHDRLHLERVHAWALRLAPEAGADPDLCGAAAIVHDLAMVPKDGADRAEGGARSAVAARPLLAAAGYVEEEIAIIVAAIATSSWSKGLPPANPVGAVLQDADRLDAIGAIGLLRTVACGQWMSRPERPGRFYDPADPCADAARPLDDRRQCVDHLPAKLLRLAAGMHTPTACAEAARRHRFLLDFMQALRSELP